MTIDYYNFYEQLQSLNKVLLLNIIFFTNTRDNSIKQSISSCNGIQSDKIQIKLVISAICTTHSKSIGKTCTIEDVQMKLSLKWIDQKVQLKWLCNWQRDVWHLSCTCEPQHNFRIMMRSIFITYHQLENSRTIV